MDETKELIGILQSISIVAQKLAGKLIKLEEEVKRREHKAEADLRSKST